MPKLPFVTSDIPRDLRAFVDRVREAFNASGKEKLITLGDLISGGVTDGDGNLIPIDPDAVYGTPPAPTNVQASGALANILVTWDPPAYRGHSYAEVWGASENNLGLAVLLGMAPGATFSDAIGSGATRYYWVRFVNVLGVIGPYNATGGTVGQTAYDPSYLLEVLSDSITTSQLSEELNSELRSIESDIQIIQAEVNDLLNTPDYSLDTNYVEGDIVKYDGGLYQAILDSLGILPTNTTYWLKIGNYDSLGSAVAAHTTQISTLTTDLGAEVTARETLATQMRGNYTGTDIALVSSGLIYSERQARATADSAEATSRATLAAQIRGGYTGTDLNLVTSGLIYEEKTARATQDTALAQDISTLTTTVNGNTTSIQTVTESVDGISGLYTVKIDNNGVLSGFGLMSTLADGGAATSDFFVNANRFAVTLPTNAMPLWTSGTAYTRNSAVRISGNNAKILVCKVAGTSGGSTPSIAGAVGSLVTDGTVTWQVSSSVPFAVLTTSATLNGTTLAPGAYIDGASIVNATINNAQIADASIDNAKITNLSASKIITGSLAVGETIQSTNYIAGSQGWAITGAGNAEFQNVTARGTIYASAGTIGSAVIGATFVRSTNYVAGSAGWRLGSDGSFEASSGTFRGSITGASGTFSGSLSSTSGTIGGVTISSGGLQSSNYVNGSAGWAIAADGQAQFNQVVIRGSLRSTSIYTGSLYRDVTSDLQINAVAATGTNQTLISDTTTPYTNSSLRVYGPNFHSSVPINQRVRNTDNGVLIPVTVVATAVVDHFFSLWYKFSNQSVWTPLTQVIEPQGGDGSAAITYTTSFGIGSDVYLEFAVSASNTSGVFQDSGKRYVKELTVGITAVNL